MITRRAAGYQLKLDFVRLATEEIVASIAAIELAWLDALLIDAGEIAAAMDEAWLLTDAGVRAATDEAWELTLAGVSAAIELAWELCPAKAEAAELTCEAAELTVVVLTAASCPLAS